MRRERLRLRRVVLTIRRWFWSDQLATAPLQRVDNQWVPWGGRFHPNQFKTTFYSPAINGMSSLPLAPVCVPGTWGKNKIYLKKPVWCCLFLMVFWRRCMLSRAMGCLLVLRNWFMSCTKMFISRLFLSSGWIRDLCAIRIPEFPNPNLGSESRSSAY